MKNLIILFVFTFFCNIYGNTSNPYHPVIFNSGRFNGGGAALNLSDTLSNNNLIIDNYGILSKNEKFSIERKLKVFLNKNNIMFKVIIVDKVKDDPIDAIANYGEINIKDKGYIGLVLLISVDNNKTYLVPCMELQEKITDLYCNKLLQNTINPYFSVNLYYEGINKTIEELDNINFSFLNSDLNNKESVNKKSIKEDLFKAIIVGYIIPFFGVSLFLIMILFAVNYIFGNSTGEFNSRVVTSIILFYIIFILLLFLIN